MFHRITAVICAESLYGPDFHAAQYKQFMAYLFSNTSQEHLIRFRLGEFAACWSSTRRGTMEYGQHKNKLWWVKIPLRYCVRVRTICATSSWSLIWPKENLETENNVRPARIFSGVGIHERDLPLDLILSALPKFCRPNSTRLHLPYRLQETFLATTRDMKLIAQLILFTYIWLVLLYMHPFIVKKILLHLTLYGIWSISWSTNSSKLYFIFTNCHEIFATIYYGKCKRITACICQTQ